jgi:23S rRNA (cytidine1920-2'-O)/16S rRNA (cytidine1409-2'-O)-methyltransferase
MVKPQFEVGRQQVGKGGVVRDDALREGAAAAVIETAPERGWRFVAQAQSRIPGPQGDREILVLLPPDAGRGSAEPEAEAS